MLRSNFMKKRNLLILLPFVSGLLAGCSIEDLMFWKKKEEKVYLIKLKIEGGSDKEQDAILNAVNYKPICYPSGNASSTIYPDDPGRLYEDSGDNLCLVRKQKIGDLEVEIEWQLDEKQEYFGSKSNVDARRTLVEIKYKGYGNENGSLKWSAKSVKCGKAVVKDLSPLKYSVSLVNFTHHHDAWTIEQMNSVTDTPIEVTHNGKYYLFESTYDINDYDASQVPEDKDFSPWWPTNNPGNPGDDGKEHTWINVKGKIIYSSPDGKWGILANGNQYTEIFAGSGTPLLPVNYPHMKDQYVEVYGEMSQYLGNFQIGFIEKITKINKSEITEPDGTFPAMNKDFINSLKNPVAKGYNSDKMAIDGFDNSLRSVTGTVDLSTLKDRNGKTVTSVDKLVDNRFTFELVVDATTKTRFTVGYDYHVSSSSNGIFAAYKKLLVDGKKLTVKGTMHYAGSDGTSFLNLIYEPFEVTSSTWNENKAKLFERTGEGVYVSQADQSFDSGKTYYTRSDFNDGKVWNIVPYEKGHIAAA